MAAALIRNVTRMATLTRLLATRTRAENIAPEILSELERLPQTNLRFTRLLDQITRLTDQLEKRYHGVLPFTTAPGRLRRVGMALRVVRDPLTELWRHNDRLERHMLDLRRQRERRLELSFPAQQATPKVSQPVNPRYSKVPARS